jgi:hypothetical protein
MAHNTRPVTATGTPHDRDTAAIIDATPQFAERRQAASKYADDYAKALAVWKVNEELIRTISNDDWTGRYLVCARLAYALLIKSDADFHDAVKNTASNGMIGSMLDDFITVRDDLRTLEQGIDCAICRSLWSLEQLGYSPDDPPPDFRNWLTK